jgi:hypothetical protein
MVSGMRDLVEKAVLPGRDKQRTLKGEMPRRFKVLALQKALVLEKLRPVGKSHGRWAEKLAKWPHPAHTDANDGFRAARFARDRPALSYPHEARRMSAKGLTALERSA